MTLKDIRNSVNEFGGLEFLANQVVEGFITGLHKSPFHGFSVEFAEHKQYNTGESTRHVDWKVYSKTEKLFVKRYEEEINLRCHILLDISSSMYYPSDSNEKIRFSVLASAAISLMLQRQRDAVGLTFFADEINYQSAIKSTNSHLHELFTELVKLLTHKKQTTSTSASSVIHQIADRIHKRSLVVIFSDMFENEKEDDLIESLKHLKHNQHEVLLFHVKDKSTEDDFEFIDRPILFVDVENGEKIKVTPSEVREQYVERITKFNQMLKLKCGQYKIDFIEVDVKKDFRQVLLPFLIKRSKM